jgi:alpha-ribazole phosphatase
MSLGEDMTVTRWWLVRHAPVVNAHLGALSGQADVGADVSDGAAFAATAAKLPPHAQWIVTPLSRTRQTAQALWAAGAHHDGEPWVEPAFMEQAFGAWTGLTWAEIGQRADAEAFWATPATQAPPASPEHAGESFADVCIRVGARLNTLTQEFGGQDIVCVAHAGAIRAAVALALGLSPEQALALDVKNTSLTRLDFVTDRLRVKRGGHWRVVGLNMI